MIVKFTLAYQSVAIDNWITLFFNLFSNVAASHFLKCVGCVCVCSRSGHADGVKLQHRRFLQFNSFFYYANDPFMRHTLVFVCDRESVHIGFYFVLIKQKHLVVILWFL